MHGRCLASGLLALVTVAGASAQEVRRTNISVGRRATFVLQQEPEGFTPDRWVPVVVLLPTDVGEDAAQATMREFGSELAKVGFVVACPVRASLERFDELGIVLTHLRRVLYIEQGGVHVAASERIDDSVAAVLANRSEIQTFTAYGRNAAADLGSLQRLPARRVYKLADATPTTFAKHLRGVHDERALTGVAADVARVLDEFHDAAANAKAQRYFEILPDDAVFLGTDGTERWTGKQFRDYAMPYFQGNSAWTYVCLRRCVNVEPGDTIAWFDETFDNAAYGECRGSGVMAKRDGRWVLRQYHLTVPVPNDLTRGVAARIRAFQEGTTLPLPLTVIVVRQAERADDSLDPELSAAGRARAASLARVLADVPISIAYTTRYRRSAQTVAPLCEARGVPTWAVGSEGGLDLVSRLRKRMGQTVLVCGDSFTIPALMKDLGVKEKVAFGDDEYDRMFVVTLAPEGARLLSLRGVVEPQTVEQQRGK